MLCHQSKGTDMFLDMVVAMMDQEPFRQKVRISGYSFVQNTWASVEPLDDCGEESVLKEISTFAKKHL